MSSFQEVTLHILRQYEYFLYNKYKINISSIIKVNKSKVLSKKDEVHNSEVDTNEIHSSEVDTSEVDFNNMLVIKKDENGVFVDKKTNFVFDSKTQLIIGKKEGTEVKVLTEKDIKLCRKMHLDIAPIIF